MNKVEQSKGLIREFKDQSVVMCSFGKDSMVLLHLVRETIGLRPVVYHKPPWFGFKNQFANSVIDSWALEVHDYPPVACGVKANDHSLELVARYPIGTQGIDLPINIEPPIPRREFVCGLEWLLRPKILGMQYPWQSVFIGHKSSDTDPFEGEVPLSCDFTHAAGVNIVFPLRHWSDSDVWEYIEEHHVPYDRRRYVGHNEVEDKWENPDYLHACTACIDPRESVEEVYCPKFKKRVKNLGDKVLRLEGLPDYIERQVA